MADAQVTIGADASAVTRAAEAAKAAWKGVGQAIAEGLTTAARTVSSDLAQVAVAQGKVSFAGQHAQVRELEAVTAHMAVSSRQNLDGLRTSIEATGIATGRQPGQVAAWSSEVGKLTYNLKGSTEAMRGISGLAAETNRTAEDYKGLAVELGTVGHVAGDTTNAIGVLTAQADALGTQGGVAAFADQIEGLSDTISHFAIGSERDFLKVTALAGELGKGLSPAAAARVQQSAFGTLAADPLRWERYLGKSVTNEHGQIEDPTQILQLITEKTKKRYGKDARRVLMLNFGAETGAAMYSANYSEAARAAGLSPAGSDAQKRLNETDAGQRGVAEATLAQSARDLTGSSSKLGAAADALQQFAASNPITSSFLSVAAGTAVTGVLGKVLKLPSALTGDTGNVIGNLLGLGGGKGKGGLAGAGGAVHVWVDNPGFGGGGGLLGGAGGAAAEAGGGLLAGAAGAVAVPALMTAGVMGLAAYQSAKTTAMIKKFNAEHTADEDASKVFGTEYARAHKATVRRGGVTLFTGGDQAYGPKTEKESVDGAKLESAIKGAFKDAKFTIVNATGGPIEVTGQTSKSASAGNQGGD